MSSDIEEAIERAKTRGLIWLNEFKVKPCEDQVEFLAKTLFYAIEHDPCGYPNGKAHWDEIPEIDHNYEAGTDKLRYREAAEMAVKLVGYMGKE